VGYHFGHIALVLVNFMVGMDAYSYSILDAVLYLVYAFNTVTQELACAPVSSVWSLCTLAPGMDPLTVSDSDMSDI